MPFSERLKSVGESYEQFLARVRSQEVKAQKCLPENKKYRKSWQKAEKETKMTEEFSSYEDWGWMNSWTKEQDQKLKDVQAQGFKFSYIRTSMGYTIGFNRELSVFYRIDTSG